MSKNTKQIKIACKGASALELSQFTELQGELKTLEKAEYEKLRNEIRDNDFSYTVHVWKDGDKYYILDGHQRLRVVKQMVEKEGYHCPPIPVSFVEAKSLAHAKKKLLAAASVYGKVNKEGLDAFLSDMNLGAEELLSSYRFADLDLGEYVELKFGLEDGVEALGPEEEEDDVPSGPAENEMRHASSHVRMVQLFFDSATQPEFMEKCNALMPVYKKDNLTDTLLEVVREAHSAKFKNA